MSEILRLLDQKVRQAEENMKEMLNNELFGTREVSNMDIKGLTKVMDQASRSTSKPSGFIVHPNTYRELNDTLASQSAYVSSRDAINMTWNGLPVYQSPGVMPGNVYAANRLTYSFPESLTKDYYIDKIKENVFNESPLMEAIKKEKEVSIVKDLRAEINHDKEVKRVTKALKKFEGSWLYKLEAGARIGFETDFGNGKTVYTYAAVFDGKYWHMTGDCSPNGISTDDLVDWMIEKHVRFGDVKLLVAKKP